MIQKPGKSTELAETYRPITILSALSKLFDKLVLPELSTIIKEHILMLDYQFDFRHKHA
jgi:hypothetical protein